MMMFSFCLLIMMLQIVNKAVRGTLTASSLIYTANPRVPFREPLFLCAPNALEESNIYQR